MCNALRFVILFQNVVIGESETLSKYYCYGHCTCAWPHGSGTPANTHKDKRAWGCSPRMNRLATSKRSLPIRQAISIDCAKAYAKGWRCGDSLAVDCMAWVADMTVKLCEVKSIFRWRALWPFLAATWDSSILTWIRQAWEPEHHLCQGR